MLRLARYLELKNCQNQSNDSNKFNIQKGYLTAINSRVPNKQAIDSLAFGSASTNTRSIKI